MDGTVLVADDDRTIRTVLTQALTRAGCRVHATSSLMTLQRWAEEGRGDLVITDVVMPDGNGLDMLPKIAAARPDLPVIVISAQNTIMTAIRANELDAFDYLPKPFDLPDLMKRSARALEARRARPRSAATPPRSTEPEAGEGLPLVGRSPAMQALYRLIARVLNADLPVLVMGESGTGKSLVARTVHDLSDRRHQPFVVADAARLAGAEGPSTVLAQARGGTILFDGVADFDAETQLRVTRMLDALPEGGPRIMATAPGPLDAAMAEGSFRADLFFRLDGVTVSLPPLRERIEDIALLAAHFLQRAARDGAAPRHLSPGALAAAKAYAWPGNLRQLERLMTRLALAAPDAEIGRAEIEQVLAGQPAARPPGALAAGERLADSVEAHLRRYFDLHGGSLPPPGLYQRILREMEAPLIAIALDATGGNQARCAELLGINRNTLRKKIGGLDLQVTRRRKLM